MRAWITPCRAKRRRLRPRRRPHCVPHLSPPPPCLSSQTSSVSRSSGSLRASASLVSRSAAFLKVRSLAVFVAPGSLTDRDPSSLLGSQPLLGTDYSLPSFTWSALLLCLELCRNRPRRPRHRSGRVRIHRVLGVPVGPACGRPHPGEACTTRRAERTDRGDLMRAGYTVLFLGTSVAYRCSSRERFI